MKTTIKILVALTLMLALMLPGARTVHAANITVTTTVDELNVNGNCSLREAIQAANTDTAVDACSAGSGADTITVPAGTYNLSMGDLDVQDVTINGTGAGSTIINQTQAGQRVFETTGVVNISRVTIQGGQTGASSTVPGHIHGGGIHNHGTLNLTNVTITHNSSTATNDFGGGLYSAGPATLVKVTIAENSAPVGKGGGIAGVAPTLINTIVA